MPQTRLIQVSERRLHASISGAGSPTILIEVGSTSAGTVDEGWQPVREQLARARQVVMYDRAGLGQSSPARIPRSLDDFAADLQALLQGLAAPPPYLMVGGSFGGMIVTHYASLHLEQVCGLVLIDPPHPEVDARTLALLPPETPAEPQSLADFRRLNVQELYAPLETFESEGLDIPASMLQASSVWNLGNLPLAVLSAGINEWEPDFPIETARAYEALWMDLQRAYAALSTHSRHWIVADSGHTIHDIRPDVVLEAVQWVLENYDSSGISPSLRACS